MKILHNFSACSCCRRFRQTELLITEQKVRENCFTPGGVRVAWKKACWSVTTARISHTALHNQKPNDVKGSEEKVKEKSFDDVRFRNCWERQKRTLFLPNRRQENFKTLTKIEGLKGLVKMLRSPAHIIGPTATAPTTTSGLFDSCHRKIRLIAPVAFFGGLMS